MPAYITTVEVGNKIRLRPWPGQIYDETKNIQGPRDMREELPLGTIWKVSALSDAGSFYRIIGDPEVCSAPRKQTKTMKRNIKKAKSTITQPINILEFI